MWGPGQRLSSSAYEQCGKMVLSEKGLIFRE